MISQSIIMGTIQLTKIPTSSTGKSGPPQKVDQFFWNFSGWTKPIHRVLDQISGHFGWMERALYVQSTFSIMTHYTDFLTELRGTG